MQVNRIVSLSAQEGNGTTRYPHIDEKFHASAPAGKYTASSAVQAA